MKYLDSLRSSLDQMMSENEFVYVIGEDILDPYGGAFKVTKGLSTKYQGRLLSSPISEALITGFGIGMAIRDFRPIVEIMFGDFLALSFDQILNSGSKFPLMYKNKVNVPLVIRTPMGGGRGYGPTHSQSIEKHFFGIPGLNVVCPSIFHNPGQLLRSSTLEDMGPTLFIENKILYTKEIYISDNKLNVTYLNENIYPTVVVKNYNEKSQDNDIIIISYGGMSSLLKEVMIKLKEEEINIALFCPSLLNKTDFIPSIEKYNMDNILIVEEGTEGFNWSSEISKNIYSKYIGSLRNEIICISTKNDIIPSSQKMEYYTIPNKEEILDKIINLLI